MKHLSRILLGLIFVAAGMYHFVNPAFYVRIMPPYLPWHYELVLLSGVAEFVLGLMVMVPRLAWPARWGLLALLIAVFPANLHMALHAEDFPDMPAAAVWIRLPLQALLMWWVWRATRTISTSE